MSDTSAPDAPSNPNRHGRTSFADVLEHGDGIAHILVGVLLLLLAVGVLVDSTYSFIHEIPHAIVVGENGHNSFPEVSLTYLSGILLGVIILELLSTILTYVRARKLEATVKDFLIVGLISSVRKILLVGAQTSIEKVTGNDFIKEAIGTIISIVGILLLIGGLILLDRRQKTAAQTSSAPSGE